MINEQINIYEVKWVNVQVKKKKVYKVGGRGDGDG